MVKTQRNSMVNEDGIGKILLCAGNASVSLCHSCILIMPTINNAYKSGNSENAVEVVCK